jgi:hypothetical protein
MKALPVPPPIGDGQGQHGGLKVSPLGVGEEWSQGWEKTLHDFGSLSYNQHRVPPVVVLGDTSTIIPRKGEGENPFYFNGLGKFRQLE